MRKDAGYFFFHLALLAAFSLFAFGHNPGRLFIGNDGPMELSLVRHQIDFFGLTLNLHNSFQQGIGNLSFPVNATIIPGFWLPFMDAAGNFMPAPIYTWFACLIFVTVLLVGWNYRFRRGVTYGAAWLLTILMFPYFEKYFAIYAITASSPLLMWYLFAAAVADIGIRRMGSGNWRSTIIYAAVALFGIFLMVAESPAAIILIVPLLAVSFAVSFFQSDRAARIRKLAAAGGILAFCAVFGWLEYVIGLLLYSSSGFFLGELIDSYSSAREFSSILFQGHIADRAFGPVLFCLATFGAGHVLYTRQHTLRIAAIVTLVGQVLHAGIGAQLLAMSGGWSGPPPIYTEMPFFMFYSLFAVYTLAVARARYAQSIPAHYLHYGLPALCVALMTCWLLARPAMNERNLLQGFAMPPAASPLTEILKKEIPALPGTPFNGRVASVLPGSMNAQMRYSYQLNYNVQNDHQTAGLWLHDIPTLHEYNQLITPAFYRLTREFLTLPNDQQNRSWTNYSYIDQRILRMLGVRFLLSLDAERDGAVKRTVLEAPFARPLYLFELPDANINGKSAEIIITVDSIQAALEAMKSPDFNLHTAVVFPPPIGGRPGGGQACSTSHECPHPGPPPTGEGVAPVETSSIALEKGAYRIRAASKGRSMLIVPIEYSRCMDITPVSGKPAQPVRVNIALTGLVFEREMDILLATRIGPFHQPRCRLADYYDFKAILKE